MGCGIVRRLRRQVAAEPLALVFSGTLLFDGQIYLLGFWTNQPTNPS